MPQAEAAVLLTAHWNAWFPAVLGPDVELRQRRELLGVLDAIRTRHGMSEESQHAATFWMGLIFLTDPPEFDGWRLPIRDAMLSCVYPPRMEFDDGWMRVLDCLLAFDPPAQWSHLTEPLAASPSLLRRAVRERVRGLAGQFEAIKNEAAACEEAGDWDGAFALWLDTGRLLAAHPAIAVEERMVTWRRDTLFRWLTEDGLVGLGEGDWRTEPGKCLLRKLPRDAALAMTPAQEDILSAAAVAAADEASAIALAGNADAAAKSQAHQCVERARLLYPFLAKPQQAGLARRLGPALVCLPIFVQGWPYKTTSTKSTAPRRYTLCKRCTRFLAELWPQLPPETRKNYGPNFRQLWQLTNPPAFLLALDAWSGSSCLSPEEWLLTAMLVSDEHRKAFQLTDASDFPADADLTKPVPIPAPRQPAMASLIPQFTAAQATLKARPGATKEQRCDEFMQALHLGDGGGPRPEWLFRLLSSWTFRFREAPKSGAAQTEAETRLALTLCCRGLHPFDAAMKGVLARQVNDGILIGSLLPDLPNPWLDVLSSPEQADAALLEALDTDDGQLRDLLSSALASPPPAPVVSALWNALRNVTRHPEKQQQLKAFGALFRLAPLATPADRLAMREEFRRFFEACPIPVREWPTQEMEPLQSNKSLRDGEGIPWEADALASTLAWSSDIKRQTYQSPAYGVAEAATGVFAFLAQAFQFNESLLFQKSGLSRVPLLESRWTRQPLQVPFGPTPWQRARALHREHPELAWPERMVYRPPGSPESW